MFRKKKDQSESLEKWKPDNTREISIEKLKEYLQYLNMHFLSFWLKYNYIWPKKEKVMEWVRMTESLTIYDLDWESEDLWWCLSVDNINMRINSWYKLAIHSEERRMWEKHKMKRWRMREWKRREKRITYWTQKKHLLEYEKMMSV